MQIGLRGWVGEGEGKEVQEEDGVLVIMLSILFLNQ